MDENEILARFGIGKKFAYGLFIQSILVIIAAILALNTLQWEFFNGGNTLEYMLAILIFLSCISLLIYSFYEYNKNTEYFFIISIILYTINKLLFLIDSLLNPMNNFAIIITVILILELICVIYFLYAFNKNYNSAKYSIILLVILEILMKLNNYLCSLLPWYVVIPHLVIVVSIALTYFERVQRGKYPKLK